MTHSMTKYYRQVIGVNTGNETLDETIYNYLVHGIPPGSFTTAVLENNLYEAICRADHVNKENIVEIVKEIGMHMPLLAWGSPDKVKLWLKDEDNRRSNYSAWMQEAATMAKMADQ